ncbi:unnamed protein product [Urochloa decumbens]|uniref:F-box domain-containing protein n=1 Tax=Urochloa decumbens TaxID=240449 RepID=A0ABC9FR54_9POAL
MASQGPEISGGNGEITGGSSAVSNDDGVLPQDAIYEILLRVPARPLCRFRAVCQSWHSLLTDPQFAAIHAARHCGEPPLFAVCVADGTHGEIRILDTSGRTVKRVNTAPASPCRMLPHLDLVLLRVDTIRGSVKPRSLTVVDPATGSISFLPSKDKHAQHSFVFGRAVSSTGGHGEYKVLSFDACAYPNEPCKILTIDGSRGTWRAAPWPPARIKLFWNGTWVVSNGIVYHLVDYVSCQIAIFDLEAEQWRPYLVEWPERVPNIIEISLAEVNERVVAVTTAVLTMDIWMLMGSGWLKQCRLDISSIQRYHGQSTVVTPLSVMKDVRVALWAYDPYNISTGSLWTYDRTNETCTHVVTIHNCRVGVGVYTGNLLR